MQIKVNIFWRNDFQAGPLGCLGGGGTAIVQVSRMCGGKDPVCETFCTNKGPKIFESALIRVQ